MRAAETELQSAVVSLSNAAGAAPGVTWTNPGSGIYDLRLTDPRARLLSVTPIPAPGATQAALTTWTPGGTPPTATVQFLSAAGAAGNFGGYVLVQWRRGS